MVRFCDLCILVMSAEQAKSASNIETVPTHCARELSGKQDVQKEATLPKLGIPDNSSHGMYSQFRTAFLPDHSREQSGRLGSNLICPSSRENGPA